MNSKMTTNNYQQLNLNNKKQETKQTTTAEKESQKWRLHEGLSVERDGEENGEKGRGNKKHSWQVENRQGEVKNSMGNGEAKELICTIHGHELGGTEGEMLVRGGMQGGVG